MKDDRSDAARAFQKLAESYVDREHELSAPAPEPVISERVQKRRFAWRS
jgi:hypothetical protein